MNLDALFEDLEAQGYFASALPVDQPQIQALCKSVVVVRASAPSISLSMPLLGHDFIAGFQNKISKSNWLLVQHYTFLEPQDAGTRLRTTELSLKKVVEKHLIGVSVKLSFTSGIAEQHGYITRTFAKMLEFVNFQAKTIWIPLAQVEYLVVDKISINP